MQIYKMLQNEQDFSDTQIFRYTIFPDTQDLQNPKAIQFSLKHLVNLYEAGSR